MSFNICFAIFHVFWKSASEDMFQENPCKTRAGRKIDVRQGLAHKVTFATWSGQCYGLGTKKIKMRSKFLENQIKSGQLSSCHVWAVPGPPPLKRSFLAFDGGGQTGRVHQMFFFPAPLTTRAPPTTVSLEEGGGNFVVDCPYQIQFTDTK